MTRVGSARRAIRLAISSTVSTRPPPVRDRDIQACEARPSTCVRRSGAGVGSVVWTNTPTFSPNIAPTRSHEGSSVGPGGAPTTTRVVSLAATMRGRVSPVDRARDEWWVIPRSEQAFLRDALRWHLRGGELDGEPIAHQQDPKRGRAGITFSKQGVWVCPAASRVDEQDGGRSPGRFVLADHQLAAAGDARPVDPSQVVALARRPASCRTRRRSETDAWRARPPRHAER